MRTIDDLKFRIWEPEYCIWDKEANKYRSEARMVYFTLTSLDGDYLSQHEITVDKHDIMQWTGLQDKNGKDIYDGDVVAWEHQGCPPFIGHVKHTEPLWLVLLLVKVVCPELDNKAVYILWPGESKRLKVIGHIYQDEYKHLMKGEKEDE